MRNELGPVFALVLLSCAPGPQPCVTPGTCPEGQDCLANRCVAAGSEPVRSDTLRLVASPTAIAVVSRTTAPGSLPAAVTFGSAAEGASALYVRFAPVWQNAREIEAAFLLLEPMPGTTPDPTEIAVEAWRIASDWNPNEIGPRSEPRLALPRARGLARSSPPATLRIDVTELVRYAKNNARSDRGMALQAHDESAHGATYATGASAGHAPRLELYVR